MTFTSKSGFQITITGDSFHLKSGFKKIFEFVFARLIGMPSLIGLLIHFFFKAKTRISLTNNM